MTPQFWNHIQPQLDEIIFNELSDSNPAYILLETLQWNNWWELHPFNKMLLHTDRNDLSFIQWLDAIENLMGDDVAEVCDEILKERIRCTIETQNAIRLKEIGEQEEHERRAA